jgi:hypothetical protein
MLVGRIFGGVVGIAVGWYEETDDGCFVGCTVGAELGCVVG